MAAELIPIGLTGFVAVFVGLAFGWSYGVKCMLTILRNHQKSGLTFEQALDYEEAVQKGEVPRG